MAPILDLIRHLPEHLQLWATDYGSGLYLILGLIIFAETGLVVTPLLPGDSLLFAAGAVLAMNLPGLNIFTMFIVLVCAAFCGDMVNYHVGKWIAPKLFSGQTIRFLNPKHLARTQEFYAKHGGKTIVLARFVPIVRTYAPFVAGLSGMKFSKYVGFCLVGATAWIGSFLMLGYFFGGQPAIKSNFHYVIAAILVISVMPVVIEFWTSRRRSV